MSACFLLASGSIELYFYGELDEAARVDVDRHLGSCADCRQALEDLRAIREALATRLDVSTPPGGDWSGFMARLDDAVRREGGAGPAAAAEHEAWRGSRRDMRYVAIAALLALVTASVAYVMRSRPALVGDSGMPRTEAAAEPAAGDPAAARRWDAQEAFASLSEEHFERSKLVVLGLASKDAREARPDEWLYERELATTLLGDTRLYRLAAEERGMTSLADVMGDLELVLLQTAMSHDPEPATLRQIQRLIQKRDLVTKMSVVAANGM